MAQQANPFTRSGALRLNHPLFRGRAAELEQLEQACLTNSDYFLLVYGGRQNGKTTVLLRLEDQLKARHAAGIRVCRVDFQGLPRATSAAAYRHVANSVQKILPNVPQPSDGLDAPALSDFLEVALADTTVQRLVLVLDELGTLPEATREDLAHVLRALHTRRLHSPVLAKAQIVFAGGIELYRLVMVEASALRNVCEPVFLGDLPAADAIAVIADGLTLVGTAPATAQFLGEAVYARVSGHPYFTQCLGERLAAQQLRGMELSEALIDTLTWALLEQNDPLLEHLRRGISELALEDSARRLLSAVQRTSRFNDGFERLRVLGLARRATQHWLPRSPLLSIALAEWLGIPMPSCRSIPEAAKTVRAHAVRQYLNELQVEQQAITSQGARAGSPAEQVRMQRRSNELTNEIARITTIVERLQLWVPALVKVFAGPFLMGSRAAEAMIHSAEKPQHRLELPDFWIGQTPITNAQFRPFVDGDGYTNPAYWTTLGWRWRTQQKISKPAYWDNSRWNSADHPVVGVSWYEAVAYCRWLSSQTGHPFRLPREAEWEKAARGPDGWIWPWGNTWQDGRCNSQELGHRCTTPVGSFPAGASRYGALDMAGNVWEWCATEYGKTYPYHPEDKWTTAYLASDELRQIRGGSWFDEQQAVRGAYRNGYRPCSRIDFFGLRVASHSPLPNPES
jgi:formylglycine-generating enzyme required for sulfatase activity